MHCFCWVPSLTTLHSPMKKELHPQITHIREHINEMVGILQTDTMCENVQEKGFIPLMAKD